MNTIKQRIKKLEAIDSVIQDLESTIEYTNNNIEEYQNRYDEDREANTYYGELVEEYTLKVQALRDVIKVLEDYATKS